MCVPCARCHRVDDGPGRPDEPPTSARQTSHGVVPLVVGDLSEPEGLQQRGRYMPNRPQ